jgi:hypothetical protein
MRLTDKSKTNEKCTLIREIKFLFKKIFEVVTARHIAKVKGYRTSVHHSIIHEIIHYYSARRERFCVLWQHSWDIDLYTLLTSSQSWNLAPDLAIASNIFDICSIWIFFQIYKRFTFNKKMTLFWYGFYNIVSNFMRSFEIFRMLSSFILKLTNCDKVRSTGSTGFPTNVCYCIFSINARSPLRFLLTYNKFVTFHSLVAHSFVISL